MFDLYHPGMTLGRRRPKRTSFWVEIRQAQAHGSHLFCNRLNQTLERAKLDIYGERGWRKYYALAMGRPSLAPGACFRCSLVGCFVGIDSRRGIAYRVSDSLSLREFWGVSLKEQAPDHSTLSETRRLTSLGSHKAVFPWVLKRLAREGVLSGKNLGVDATALEANAALRAIVRRDNGAHHGEHIRQLMKDRGVEEPIPVERRRYDCKREKWLRNRDWVNRHDRQARITKMKDGRTHLDYKAEPAVDLDTGTVVAVTAHPADCGHTVSMQTTLARAGCTVTEPAGKAAKADAVAPVETVSEVGLEQVMADKGYHGRQVLEEWAAAAVRTVIAEPERKPQKRAGPRAAQPAVYANRRRLNSKIGEALMRRRGELIERSFAHFYDSGGMRRVQLRGKDNIARSLLIHAAGFHLSLILRQLLGAGAARQATDLPGALCSAFLRRIQTASEAFVMIGAGYREARLLCEPNRYRWPHRHHVTLSTGCYEHGLP